MCRACQYKSMMGKRLSPNTEWKPGKGPASHLRDNFGNKFNVATVVDRTYRGVVYHSKMESEYARYLDILLAGKRIASWEGQVSFDIILNGVLLSRYFCDFKVMLTNGTIEYHEVKGYSTQLYQLKRKLVEAIHGVEIKEIKKFKLSKAFRQ